MAVDLLKILREVRGTGLPEEEYTDGIYYDIKSKPTEDDGVTQRLAPGMYESMKVMAGAAAIVVTMTDEIDAVVAISDEIVTVADNIDGTVSTAITDIHAELAKITNVSDNLDDVTNFADVYYGPKAADPTLRNDGTAMVEGDIYFNTSDSIVYTYTGAVWTSNRDRSVHIGTQVAATISDFNDAVGAATNITGIIDIEPVVAQNADITKIDIAPFSYYILGVHYTEPGGTAIVPTIGAGDSSTFIGVDATGIIYSTSKFTTVQTQTIVPLARLQAVQGQSGPGSELQTPLPLIYTIGQFGYTDRDWIENAVGALYATGGTFSENVTTPLQVDQSAGNFHNAQRLHIDIPQDSNIEASVLYNISSVPTLQTRATLVVPKFYDNGTDIVALSNNKYASHTLLRSPKAENVFIFVYSNQQYNSLADAEQANIDFSIFVSQSTSGMIAVARFILKGDSSNIISIIDERPSIGGTQSAIIGTATVQQVYDNSSTPEIVTDGVRGALTVKRGSAADTDNVYEGKNGAGDTTFSVTGNGDVALSGTVDGRDVGVDGAKLDGVEDAATADQTATEIATAYEGISNTNKYTDSEKAELAATYSQTEVDNEITNRAQQGKNAIINGDFGVNQYDDIDTAPVACANGKYYIDRNRTLLSISSATIQRLIGVLVNGIYVNSLKLVAGATESATLGTTQRFESFYKGQVKTLSKWVKSNSNQARISIYDGATETLSEPHSGGGTYELLKVTKTISSSATTLDVRCRLMSSGGSVSITSGDYIESTMWQLEPGVVPTDFEQLKPSQQLADSKRYLPYRSKLGASTAHDSGFALSATICRIIIKFKVTARVAPTALTDVGNFKLYGGGSVISVASMAITTSTVDYAQISVTVAGGLTTNTLYYLRNDADDTAYIEIQTEL